MAENLHKDHRKRLRKELIEQDFPDSMSDHKVLETLLFYGIPQKDTNELAHTLINTFGSLTAVFEADSDALFQVKGMTERAVVLIKLMLPLFRRYYSQRNSFNRKFASVEHICEELVRKHSGYGREVFILTSLNEIGDLICFDVLAKGSSTAVQFDSKEIVQKALKHGATFVIISHNHLTGNIKPSKVDLQSTQRLWFTLNEIGIKLLDHIIVSGNEYFSIAKNNLLKPNI
ncbi:MAG: hypothetical protein E7537_01350 [Ruminococcaceae bacterium]|nr:hypothetical protein [Oscillospiraceae bacterium]